MKMLPPYFSTFQKKSGQASGRYYKAKLAGCGDVIGEFAIIAPDAEIIRKVWEKITSHPLNENDIQDVIIFSEEALTSKK